MALAWTPSPSISLALLGGPQEMSATPLCSGSCCASVDVAGMKDPSYFPMDKIKSSESTLEAPSTVHGLLRSLPLAMPGCSFCPSPPSIASQGNHLFSESLLSGTHKETLPHVLPAAAVGLCLRPEFLFSHNCLGMAENLGVSRPASRCYFSS